MLIRYIGGSKTTRQLQKNEVTDTKSTVTRLQINLPAQQTVYFDDNVKDDVIKSFKTNQMSR